MKIQVKVRNESAFPLPSYQTSGSAGMDLRANIAEEVLLGPLQRQLVPTGLFIELPEGHEAQVRPRSGLAFKHGLVSSRYNFMNKKNYMPKWPSLNIPP
jgi:dUTP pyrophosphatase